MYVEKLTMKDFRCFEQAEVSFVYPGKEGLPDEALPNVTLLIGINGTGKTSVLRGVALTCLSPVSTMMGYFPYYLVRVGKRTGKKTALINARIHQSQDDLLDHSQQLYRPGLVKSLIEIARIESTDYFSKYAWKATGYGIHGETLIPTTSPKEVSTGFFGGNSPVDQFLLNRR